MRYNEIKIVKPELQIISRTKAQVKSVTNYMIQYSGNATESFLLILGNSGSVPQ